MKELLLVAGQELIVNLRRPGYLLMTLLFPALGLITLLAGSMFGGELGSFFATQFVPSQDNVGYVDQSGLLRTDLADYEGQFTVYAKEEVARAALLAQEIDSYFVLPPDYLQTGKVYVYGGGGGFSAMVTADTQAMNHFLIDSLLSERVDPAIQARVKAPLQVEPVTLDKEGEVKPEGAFSWLGDFVIPYVFSFLFLITIFTTSGFLLQSVSTEKEGRIIEMLLSSISPTTLLAGKILGLGTLGLIQVLIWFGSGVALIAATAAIFAVTGLIKISAVTVLLAIVYFVLGYLLFATLMAVAGSMGTTMRESQQIAGIFSIVAAIPYMGINFMFTNPNSPFVVALSYIPVTSPVMMLIRLGFGQVPPAQVAISLVLLIAGLAFSLWAGAKVFRVGLLMYGQRPGLREIVRAFRQA